MPGRFIRKSGNYTVRVLTGLLVAIGFLVWLMGTEPALRWGAQQAERISAGRLTLQGVHGSLYGPLQIETLGFQTDEQRIELNEASLDWSPRSLFGWHVQVGRLTVQELRIIETRPSTKPAKLPETLHWPMSLSAPAIRIERVVIRGASAEHVLSAIDIGVEKPADDYKLKLRNISTEWGNGEAEILLGDTRPFNVAAHATLQRKAGWAYRADAEASGNLVQLLIKARANAMGGQAALTARLRPFEDNPLIDAHLKADGMNPALIRKGLPQADLSAVASIVGQGPDRLEGNITARNGQPGTWDQSRLPLRELAARFSGTLNQLNLHAIHLDLAEAGSFKGDGQIGEPRMRFDLATTNFNPQGVHGKMRPMRLAGDIRLQAGRTGGQALSADLRHQGLQLHLEAHHQDALIELRKATLQSGTSSLALHGTLALDGLQPFQLVGALQGFNPADFGNYPAARINASFSGTGHLATEPQVMLGFAVTDSHFRHQTLSGRGNLNISTSRIWNSTVKLRLARNQLELKGALGNPGDHLVFQAEVDDLAKFDPELGGQIHATGTLEGRFSAPSGNIDIRASGLSWRKQYRLASLLATGRLEQGADGPLHLDARLGELDSQQLHLEKASLHAQGTRARHTLQFQAKSTDFDLESRFSGGWHDASGWIGQVTDLSNRGRHALTLKSPARLEADRQRLLLGNAHFDFVGAQLTLHELAYDAGQIASRGEIKGMPLAYLQGFSAQDAGLKTDLTLGGEWRLSTRESVNGFIGLWRERGDITLPTLPRTALGLRSISLKVEATNNRLEGRLEASGTKLGSLKADAEVTLSSRNSIWGIAGNAPVRANAGLAIESLAWIGPLLDTTGALSLEGALKAEFHAGGTFAQPKLAGGVSGNHISLALPEQGLHFTEGNIQGEWLDQTLHLRTLSLRAGEGTLTGQGRLSLEGESPVMHLALKAEKLEMLSRPDRHLILSGTADASASGSKIRFAAKLKADRGLIELPKGDAPRPSDDVVVLGRTKTAEKKTTPYTVGFDLDLDLGDRFFVKGKGLDAQLGGTLRLTSENGAAPASRGNIRVLKGAYQAYGQRLEIERGILNFQGPADDPGLDIIALRKNQPVEAGVALTGTVQSPRVRLVSNPGVPDSEKLSWLVLGHGLEDSGSQEFGALQAAAGALLAAGESVTLQQRIAHAAGLEEVSFKGASALENTVLALGKRLSSRAYLSYEQGLTGAGALVKINYTLTRRLSIRAQAGSVPAMDLFYTFSFD